MSYILDALRRADSERERGSVPGLHAQAIALDEDDDEAPRRAIPWTWIAIGSLVALIALLAWQLLDRDAPRELAQPAPPVAATPVPAPVAPAATVTPVFAPTTQPEPDASNRKAATAPARSEIPASASAGDNRVYAVNELPDNIRRELPALNIGGSIGSSNPANRMLIINGQLFHEGDKLAAELSLEQIKLKAVVLKFKGYRYTISF